MKPVHILLKVGGSLLAAVAGTLAGVGAMHLLGWEDWRVSLLLISCFAVPMWAIVLLPMHVLLPPSSELWRPGASSAFGGVAASVVLSGYFVIERVAFFPLFLPIAIFVGIVTGLTGSAFARVYGKLSRSAEMRRIS